MNVNQAVSKRVSNLLVKNNMTQYRLERNSGVIPQTLASIMKGKNKTVTFSTIIMIAKGFNMTLLEFLDDPLFDYDNLEAE